MISSTALLWVIAAFPCTILSSVSGAPGHATGIANLNRRQNVGAYPAPDNNDYSCSSVHNPIVFLHGLGATYYEDLNVLQTNLTGQGFCGFAITYGAYPEFPYVGGLKSIATSAAQLADFIKGVQNQTGASKVDLVGHSEGAFLALYMPKFEAGISEIVDNVIAIAPPTHGTTFGGIFDFAYVGGNVTRQLNGEILETVGCDACNDLGPDGPAVEKLNDGTPIRQNGNTMSIIISKRDELVTPYTTAEVNEADVDNIFIQDACPNDHVGHIGEAYDTYVWGLIRNKLDPSLELYPCSQGMEY